MTSNAREALKRHFPWLIPVVRGVRRRTNQVRAYLDVCLFGLTLGRGIPRSIRAGIRFRSHPLAWRTCFFAFAAGGYVEEELDAFIAQCKADMQLIDVGAAYGIFSLVAATWPNSKALLIEPYPKCVRMLRTLQRMNGLSDDRFAILPVAAGPQDGWLAVEERDRICLVSSPASATSVPMRSLDSLCSELSFRPTHIKIDVEGFELAVLKGAAGTLRQCKPVVHLEIHNEFILDAGGDPKEIDEFMKASGYRRSWILEERASKGGVLVARTMWEPGKGPRPR